MKEQEVIRKEAFSLWKKVLILLVITGVSTLLVWRWGSRFKAAPGHAAESSLQAHYAVEGIHAELYDDTDLKSTSVSKQVHIDAERLEALDQEGGRWLITAPSMIGRDVDGKTLFVKGPVAQWDHSLREGYFPEAVEARLEQAGKPAAQLNTTQLKWNARSHHLTTKRAFVLVYDGQSLHAVGLDWALDTGIIQLGSHIHLRANMGR